MKPTRPPPTTETGRPDNGRDHHRTRPPPDDRTRKETDTERSEQEKTYVKNAYVFFRRNFLCQNFEGGISPSGSWRVGVITVVPPHTINSKICTTNPLKSAHPSLQKRGGGLLPKISNKYPLAYKPL